MSVLGIDPGMRNVGYGLIKIVNQQYDVIDHGVFHINQKLPFQNRLEQIYQSIHSYILKMNPDVVAVEEVFVCKNAKTTLKLGHARGVILLAAAIEKISVSEFAPREIKQAIVGNGSAAKEQVQWMISTLLKIPRTELQEDAADALAAALCFGYRNKDIVNV